MLKLKPEKKETTMTTVILGKFKYVYIKWTRLVESCMIFPLQPQYLEQIYTVINQSGLFHPKNNNIDCL